MGIRGLSGWVKWASPQNIKTPNWAEYSGKKIGIDILGQLYKIKAQRACPLMYMAHLISACKMYNIQPIFVFDGKPPDAKRDTLKQRNAVRTESLETLKHLETVVAPLATTDTEKDILEKRIRSLMVNTSYFSSEERDLCKQLCYAAGVLCVNATGEADDVLAYLFKSGYISAVISSDLDLLARGVDDLFVPQTWSMPGDEEGWQAYNLTKILGAVNLSYDAFVEMCVLMGSDYNSCQKVLPYRSAYWAIKYRGDLLKTLDVLGVNDETPYYDAIKRLKGLCETKESLMGEKQWAKLASDPPPVEKDSLQLFRSGPLKTLPTVLFDALH